MKKGFIASLCITAAQFIAAALVYTRLPEQIPTHWGISGQVDAYGGRLMIFLMPAISLLITLGMTLMPKIDPKGKSIIASGNAYPVLMVLINVLFAVILAVTILTAFGVSVPMDVVMCVMLGLLFIILGSFMPRIKQNYSFGIKLPWTYASEEVWVSTHRFGGRVFVANGLVFFAGVLLPAPLNLLVPLVAILVGMIVICVFSYLQYRKTNVN